MKKIKAIIRLIKAKDWCLLTHGNGGNFNRIFDTKDFSDGLIYITTWLEEELKVFKQGKIKG